MQNVSNQELINQDELQRLQDEFCRVAGLYAYCMDAGGEAVTEMSGTGAGVFEALSRDELRSLQNSPYAQRAFERVEEGSLEDIAVERFPGGRLAAVAISPEGKPILYWMLFDCSDREELAFSQAADLVRDVCIALYTNKVSRMDAQIERSKSLNEQQVMGKTLQRIEATTGIVQLLDCDERIEVVIDNWLRILGQQLQPESMELYWLNADNVTMDIEACWCNQDVCVPYEQRDGLEVCSMLRTDKPQVYSTGGIPGEHRFEANYYGVSAIMIFPVFGAANGRTMVLSVDYRRQSHNWDTSEVKFTADAVKVLQSILARRLQEKSIAGSHAVLETVLDNVGCAIYVTDLRTNETLFANRKLCSAFAGEMQNGSMGEWIQRAVQCSNERGTTELYHEDTSCWYEMLCEEIIWVDGQTVMLYSFYDVTDRLSEQG